MECARLRCLTNSNEAPKGATVSLDALRATAL